LENAVLLAGVLLELFSSFLYIMSFRLKRDEGKAVEEDDDVELENDIEAEE
jgi:hypothetical protein